MGEKGGESDYMLRIQHEFKWWNEEFYWLSEMKVEFECGCVCETGIRFSDASGRHAILLWTYRLHINCICLCHLGIHF